MDRTTGQQTRPGIGAGYTRVFQKKHIVFMKAHQKTRDLKSKRSLASLLGLGALVLMSISLPSAKAQLLTYYNFNDGPASGQSANTAELTSDAPGQQTTTISSTFANATTGGTTTATNTGIGSVGGTTLNQASGDTNTATGLSLALIGGTGATTGGTGGNNGKYFEIDGINTTTVGTNPNTGAAADLSLSFAFQRTTTGFSSQAIAYSTDGGATFTTLTTAALAATTFATSTFTLPGTAVDNVSNLEIRFTLTGATSSSGNNRFDNIQLTVVPEPTTVLGGALIVGAFGWSQRRRFITLRRLG